MTLLYSYSFKSIHVRWILILLELVIPCPIIIILVHQELFLIHNIILVYIFFLSTNTFEKKNILAGFSFLWEMIFAIFPFVHVHISIRITSRQAWRYTVFPFIHMRIRITSRQAWRYTVFPFIHIRIRITSRQAWRYTVFPFTHTYPYHIQTGLKIYSVPIHTYTYPSYVWIATRSDSNRWRIHLLAWAMAGSH